MCIFLTGPLELGNSLNKTTYHCHVPILGTVLVRLIEGNELKMGKRHSPDPYVVVLDENNNEKARSNAAGLFACRRHRIPALSYK